MPAPFFRTDQLAFGHGGSSRGDWSATTEPDTVTVPDTGDVQAITAGALVDGWSTTRSRASGMATNGVPFGSFQPARLPLIVGAGVESLVALASS